MNKVLSLSPIINLFTSFTSSLTVASFTTSKANNALAITTVVRPPDPFVPAEV